MNATIERRLLINYRMDPELAQRMVPDPFRVQLVEGSAVAGICLIRLGQLRPAAWPFSRESDVAGLARWGWRAENAAHRIAVEWPGNSGLERGVFIPLRHSSSWLPVLVGGRLFPAVHRKASFTVRETADETRSHVAVSMSSAQARLSAQVTASGSVPWRSKLFNDLTAASNFYQRAAVAWSPASDGRSVEGVRLQTGQWKVEAAELQSLSSSFFESLPASAIALDQALLMRNISSHWRSCGTLPTGKVPALQ
ncbi:DUF2071 domain-containing protein [Psychromicrobium sp. YIM B11713]|uniref:DUF2071 domain-containing protein n=1 Tax=Psychromicrobium sp. YIM B11713 TaxID=3145233 RepID=UPI00374F6735